MIQYPYIITERLKIIVDFPAGPGTGSQDFPASNQGEVRKKDTSRLLWFRSHDELNCDGHADAR